ncbi:unnamed protein product, partial [Ectocarpus sp. 12 AP-2014]
AIGYFLLFRLLRLQRDRYVGRGAISILHGIECLQAQSRVLPPTALLVFRNVAAEVVNDDAYTRLSLICTIFLENPRWSTRLFHTRETLDQVVVRSEKSARRFLRGAASGRSFCLHQHT